MTLAYPVDVAVNPNTPAQRYVLWGNGRIDTYGGAVPVTDGPTWYDRYDQPVAVALHITDWATGAGYVLDFAGGIHAFGGAPVIVSQSGDTWVNSNGLPYVGYRFYGGWSWDPAGTGQGYAIDLYGGLHAFGGAPAPARTGPRWTHPAVKGFAMQWTPSMKALTLDYSGGLWADWAATLPTPAARYFAGVDVARDLVVTDWATISGYVLTADGATHAFGSAASPMFGGPYRPGADVARQLYVLNAEDPTRLWQVHHGGQSFEYVASDPPTVIAGGDVAISPAATVTDTTRPVLSWSYSDPQSDSQAAWELYVFTQAFVTAHSMTDPGVWAADAVFADSGINPTTRGVTPTVDLANDDYRMYVRAKDTADQWSAWDDHAWTQNVPVPATPTGLTATADDDAFTVALSVSTSEDADFVRFLYTDDGVTWQSVVGAEAVPIAATTTATDDTIPFGVTRTYAAVAFSAEPRTASEQSATTTATVDAATYALTIPGAPGYGGEVHAVEPSEWTRPVSSAVHWPKGSKFPKVVRDGGGPKARQGTVHLLALDAESLATIVSLAEASTTMLYRDPHGRAIFCELVGDWPEALMPGAATRHYFTTDLQMQEVAPPVVDV